MDRVDMTDAKHWQRVAEPNNSTVCCTHCAINQFKQTDDLLLDVCRVASTYRGVGRVSCFNSHLQPASPEAKAYIVALKLTM
jgi:hypothetical protein